MQINKVIRKRVIGIALAFLLQIVVIIGISALIANGVPHYGLFSLILSFLFGVIIINTYEEPEYKISWLFILSLFPIAGGIFYFFLRNKDVFNNGQKKLSDLETDLHKYILDNKQVIEELNLENKEAGKIAKFIEDYSSNSPSTSTESTYYNSGESIFEAILEDMKKAEKYIFMEFYIVEKGILMDQMMEVLFEKVKEGVDVRFIMDDAGTIFRISNADIEYYRENGVKMAIFNPIQHRLSLKYNHRSHRKSVIIDGEIAYTGGINIGDNYINADGWEHHWKDGGIRIQGEATWGITVIFLALWMSITSEPEDIDSFYPNYQKYPADLSNGVVQPFSDDPLNDIQVTESIYLRMIYEAKDYIYVKTPYLILSKKLLSAIETAVRAGVTVRLVTPGIPDKSVVYECSRSYYQHLVDLGAEIYEYAPGFIHEKSIIIDGTMGITGTVNLDFRAMYLNYECGVWLYKTECLPEMVEDFEQVFEVSTRISNDIAKSYSDGKKVYHSLLRIFAPLF